MEVGDVCISLTPRTGPPLGPNTTANASISSKSNSRTFAQQPKSQYYPQPELHTNSNVDNNCFPPQLPQNLSRKSQTILTTATAMAISSRSSHPSYDFNHQQQLQLSHYSTTQYLNGRTNGSTIGNTNSLYRNHSMEPNIPKSSVPITNLNVNEARSLSPDTDGAIDATTLSSRKRRWSAPDNNICDVDGCQTESKKCTLH